MNFYHGLRGAAAQKRMLELLDLVKLPAVDREAPARRSVGRAEAAREPGARARSRPRTDSLRRSNFGARYRRRRGDPRSARELRRELGVSYMFISHDISTVRAICDDVIVLYAGQCVEAGQRDVLAAPPYHPYTGSARRLGTGIAARLARCAARAYACPIAGDGTLERQRVSCAASALAAGCASTASATSRRRR